MLLGAISKKFDIIVEFTAFEDFISFERKGKKGIGLVIEDKVETGYSSWAKDKDIKTDRGIEAVDYTAPTVKAAGMLLLMTLRKKFPLTNSSFGSKAKTNDGIPIVNAVINVN